MTKSEKVRKKWKKYCTSTFPPVEGVLRRIIPLLGQGGRIHPLSAHCPVKVASAAKYPWNLLWRDNLPRVVEDIFHAWQARWSTTHWIWSFSETAVVSSCALIFLCINLCICVERHFCKSGIVRYFYSFRSPRPPITQSSATKNLFFFLFVSSFLGSWKYFRVWYVHVVVF